MNFDTSNIIEDLSSIITDEKISNEFDIYRETEEYKKYFELIKIENERMSDYLINMAIFGFWHQENYGGILEKELPKKLPEPVKGDILGAVHYYDNFDHYLQKNPEVKIIGKNLEISESNDISKDLIKNFIIE